MSVSLVLDAMGQHGRLLRRSMCDVTDQSLVTHELQS